MLIGVAVFGYLDKGAAATVTVLAGAIGMAFANIDKIELFKGAGFEARMRKAVEEAYATTDSLRSLAQVMAEVVAGVLAVENRCAGLGRKRKLRMKKEIDGILLDMEVNKEGVEKVGQLFDAYLNFDHANRIKELIINYPNITDPIKQEAEKLAVFSKEADTEELYSAKPAEFREFISKHKIESNDIDEAINDYEYFSKEYDLRMPENWD